MEDTTQRLQEAIASARAGQLSEAKAIAEEITESDPNNAHAWFLRGILSEDEEQQAEYLGKTLAIDPEHKAARKRMEQMQPPVEAEEEQGPVDEGEPMVVEAAVTADVVEDEAVEDEAVADTMIAETPYVEEMSPEDVVVEELFAAEDEAVESEDEDMATVIAAAAVLGDEAEVLPEAEPSPDTGGPDAGAQELEAQELEAALAEAEEPGLDAEDLVVAAAAGAAVDQAGEAWFEEEAEDELWSKVEAEAVPDWLLEDTSAEADEALVEELPPAEPDTEPGQDLPDWLLDEPEDEWPEPDVEEIVEEETLIEEDADEAVAVAAVDAAADEEEEEEVEIMPAEEEPVPAEEEPAPAKPKKKSSTRGLEILLILLVIVAIVVLAALVYFIVSPPSF